ncbi:hypothetical protein GF323_01595 [Candidatus Woesearchaeota archaeon]|nr:hypothetical protein [Candidatus Woesearchaeota archaeon]
MNEPNRASLKKDAQILEKRARYFLESTDIKKILGSEDYSGKVDYDSGAKAWDLLLELSEINQFYESWNFDARISLIGRGVLINYLMLKEYELMRYIHNSLLKNIYMNTKEMSQMPDNPEEARPGQADTVKNYLKSVRDLDSLETRMKHLGSFIYHSYGEIADKIFCSAADKELMAENVSKFKQYQK